LAQLLGMFCGCALMYLLSPENFLNYRLCILFVGVWWFIWTLPSFLWLKKRPSEEMPARGIAACWFGVQRTLNTFRRARNFPQTLRYLIASFFFCDMASTIPTVGILIASDQLCMGQVDLVMLVFLCTLLSAAGCYGAMLVVRMSG